MKSIIYISLSLLILISSCESSKERKEEKIPDSENIVFSKTKSELAGIESSSVVYQGLSELIYCKGVIEAMPGNRAKISTLIEAYVESIHVHNGERVKKGDILLRLQHPKFIEIQKDYLQAASELEFLEQEYERQKMLKEGEAGTEKIFQKVYSQLQMIKAERQSLKLYLKMLNIDADKLTAQKISSVMSILSPIDGIVNSMDITIGELVESDDVLMVIINNDGFHISLQIFEQDINKIKIGQMLSYKLSNSKSKDKNSRAKIAFIGNKVDDVSNTFEVHAIPIGEIENTYHGMYLNAEIESADSLKQLINEDAVVDYNGFSYVFVIESDTLFIPQKVKTGINERGFVEIKSPDLSNKKIVTTGSNYLIAEIDTEEE